MSIDKFFDAYVEKRGIVPSAAVVPEHPCQIFQEGSREDSTREDSTDGVDGADGADGVGGQVPGLPGEKSHSALEKARELVKRGLAD